MAAFRGGALRRVKFVVALVVVAGTVLGLGVAFGAGGLDYVSNDGNVPNTEPGRTDVTAHCTGGRHVTGGGLEVEGDNSNFDLEVGKTLPNAQHDAWVGGANNSGPAAATATTFAICSSANLIYESASKNVALGDVLRKKVSCPAHSKVVGGGVGAPGDHGVEVFQSQPRDGNDANIKADDGWVGGENNSSNGPQKVTVVAICSKTLDIKPVTGPRKTVQADSEGSATVFCPNGKQVLGGGANTKPHSTDIEIKSSFPVDGPGGDSKPDDGWKVATNNDAPPGGQSFKMRALAFCT